MPSAADQGRPVVFVVPRCHIDNLRTDCSRRYDRGGLGDIATRRSDPRPSLVRQAENDSITLDPNVEVREMDSSKNLRFTEATGICKTSHYLPLDRSGENLSSSDISAREVGWVARVDVISDPPADCS